jgi:hypothetical protein
LIATLPLVRQVDVVPVPDSWQFGSASAAGAETPSSAIKLTSNSADVHSRVKVLPDFRSSISDNPI